MISRQIDDARAGELLVARWYEAFNERDLAAMLACVDRDVDFRPLRLDGQEQGHYRGRDGVERWMADVESSGLPERLEIADFYVADDVVFADGFLCAGDGATIVPFCAVHRLEARSIISAHHYFSDRETLMRLGMLT